MYSFVDFTVYYTPGTAKNKSGSNVINFGWYSGCHPEPVEEFSIRKPLLIINIGYSLKG